MKTPRRRASDRAFAGPLCSRVRHARRLTKLSQAAFAKTLGVGASAVAQWEVPRGTSPTIPHLIEIAVLAGVAFEWLATGRGPVGLAGQETPAIDASSFTVDHGEDRLLAAYRRIPTRKRESFLRWMEEFF